MALSFETKKSAKQKRQLTLNDNNEPAAKRKKDHIGTNETWDKEALKAEVEGYEDNYSVSWRQLATRYNVTSSSGDLAQNGGQIVKEWLVSQGVDINRLQTRERNNPVIRRRKRKGPGGEIPMPTDVHPDEIKKQLHKKILTGEYDIGEMIVPRKYQKLVLNKSNNHIEKVECTAEGRKITLEDIRRKMLQKHRPYLRIRSNEEYDNLSEQEVRERLDSLNELQNSSHLPPQEQKKRLRTIERTRHLLVWLDNSTVANHGYLVCLITCLYDPAVFLTSEEYKLKTGQSLCVQKVIETPEVHFIARCGSSDSELLMYNETRVDCIQGLKQNIKLENEDVEFVDVQRFCHGDSPLRAFETGQQKGGNYFCSSCGVHCSMTSELDHVLNCPFLSLQDRQDKVLKGVVARRNSNSLNAKPLKKLKIRELEEELVSRSIYDGKTKNDLEKLLVEEMHGIQRVPALLYNSPNSSLATLGLGQYEVLPAEPLHDIGHHIENVLTELPHHLPEIESKLLKESIELCLGNKDSKRTVDYRVALVKITGLAHNSIQVTERTLAFLDSLVEVQRILYLPEEQRCPSIIIRYYNQVWLHSILLKELIPVPKSLTSRKLYGIYFHNLFAHAGLMLRIVSGQAANTEDQERIFNHLKRITKTTSNYHTGQIIPNMLVRLQAEKEMGDLEDTVSNQQSHITKLTKSLPPRKNTCIPLHTIRKYNREWQAHLQQISDFLLEGKDKWWSKNEETIEFHDELNLPDEQTTGPSLHHFRSSTLKKESTYLQTSWEKCIKDKIAIPTHIVRIDQPDGTTKTIHMSYLNDTEEGFDQLPDDAAPCPVSCNDDTTENNSSPSTNTENSNDIIPQSPEESYNNSTFQDEDNYHDDEVIEIRPVPDEIIILQEPETPSHKISSPNNEVPTDEITQDQRSNENVVQSVPKSTSHHQKYQLQSRLGKAIAVVLGETEEIFTFERKYLQLKRMMKNNRNRIDDETLKIKSTYTDSLARIQVKVLAEKSRAKQALNKWEKEYLLNNELNSPSYDEMKSERTASDLLKKHKHAEALLKEWKMNF